MLALRMHTHILMAVVHDVLCPVLSMFVFVVCFVACSVCALRSMSRTTLQFYLAHLL